MAAGDVTKLPTAGIQFDFDVTAIGGNGTTMYIATADGRVRSLTSTGVLADLTKAIKLNERIVAIDYVSTSLIFITDKGKIYTCSTAGASLTLLKDLNMGVKTAYYYNGFYYVVLDGIQQKGSFFLKIATA